MTSPPDRDPTRATEVGVIEVRAIRSHEWRRAKELRLRALADELAPIAFFETAEEAAERTDADWERRALELSTDAEVADRRQFVAVDPGGRWVGSLSVAVQEIGAPLFGGGVLDRNQGAVFGVWVEPTHRGTGLIDRLVEAATDWLAESGIERASLWVQRDNIPAQRAYARCGFTPSGRTVVDRIGPELEMVRAVSG